MKVLFTALRALVYMIAFILLWRWLALGSRTFDASLGVTLPDWLRFSGIPAMVAGGLIVLWCIAFFVARGRGTPAPFDPPREFVASGPYRIVRNPMYVGGLVLLLGYGLWQRSLAMLIFVLVAVLLIHLFVILYEEPTLEQRFGNSYIVYKQNVNRWCPRWPTSRNTASSHK